MKKLLSVYGVIMVVIICFVATCMVSCSQSGKKVYTSIPPDSTVVLRTMSLKDSVITAVKVKQRDNVYKVGDEVWVLTRDTKDLKIVNISSDVQLPDNALSYGYYSRFRILPIR